VFPSTTADEGESATTDRIPSSSEVGAHDGVGHEWIKRDGGDWYRISGSDSEWQLWNNENQ
jgi:hypothetical protein